MSDWESSRSPVQEQVTNVHGVLVLLERECMACCRALMGTLLMGCFRAEGEATQVGSLADAVCSARRLA